VFAEKFAAASTPTPSATTAQQPQTASNADAARLAAATRPAVVLITVKDRTEKPAKFGTGFFVSNDGKLVTNAHVVEGAVSAEAKLETGATYNIVGVLKAAPEKDLVLLQADARSVPFLNVAQAALPEVGTSIVVVGSPFGLEGTVSNGIISAQRVAQKNDQMLQMTAPVSPGSSGSPVIDSEGKVVGVATFVLRQGQALNFARPVIYVSELLDQAKVAAEPQPLWTVSSDAKRVILNDPQFLAAQTRLAAGDAAQALKLLNEIDPKYPENPFLLSEFGLAYDELNLDDDAVRAFQHAVKLQPTDGVTWTNLGATLLKTRRFSEANEAATQAVKQAPDFAPAWKLLAATYKQQGRSEDAVNAFERASKLRAPDTESAKSLSRSYVRLIESAKNSQDFAIVTATAAPLSFSPMPGGSRQATAATPQTTPTSNEYKQFVQDALHSFETHDLNRIASTYAERVEYRDYGVRDREFIRRDLEKYFSRWPITRIEFDGEVKVEDTKKPNEKVLRFKYKFNTASPDRHSFSAGVANTSWWVWSTPDGLKIFAERQKVSRTPKR
jgi:tetratricopeptide (TPR) repeat protein